MEGAQGYNVGSLTCAARSATAGLVWSAIFSPGGDAVLTSSGDWTARLFDVETEECLRIFSGHEERVLAAVFLPAPVIVGSAKTADDEGHGLSPKSEGRHLDCEDKRRLSLPVETVPFLQWNLHRYGRAYGDRRDSGRRPGKSENYNAQRADRDMVYTFRYKPSGKQLGPQGIRLPPTLSTLEECPDGPFSWQPVETKKQLVLLELSKLSGTICVLRNDAATCRAGSLTSRRWLLRKKMQPKTSHPGCTERRAARSLKKSASAPAPTAPILPVKRSSRTRWTPLFRDPTFGGSIGHSGDHRKAKPTLKPSRFVFEDEAELLLTNDGRQRTGEAMSDRLQAVWKIVVQEEEEKPDSPPTPSLLDVFAPPDSALPRIDASTSPNPVWLEMAVSPVAPPALSLAAGLLELANELQRSEQGCEGVVIDARNKVQRTLATCWEGRPLPRACLALRNFLSESALSADVEVKLVKPNGESGFVGMLLRKGVPEAMVKYRGELPGIPFREECNYVFAEWLGFSDVVAPCIAVDLPLTLADFSSLSVLDVLREHTAAWVHEKEQNCKTWPANMWVTMEKCVLIGETEHAPTAPASRLANFFGSVDLLQAYAATPSGPSCGVDALLRDTYTRQEPTDADFFRLVSCLDVQNIHRLCMLACITLQRDGGPSNLMVRQKTAGEADASFELVSIDSTRVLNGFPSDALLLFDDSDGTIGQFTYWFPACVELPQAAEILHPSVASALRSLDASTVECFLEQLLSVPGASLARSRSEAKAASNRLRHLQSLLEDQELTARDLCFRVVPTWEADYWAPGRRELIPFHDLGVHLHAGGSAQEWEEKCRWPYGSQRDETEGARKISRLSTGSAFSNISSMSRQSSTGAVPQLVSRTASDDPVAHRPSQDSRTSSLVDSKESKGSGSVRASSKLSRDSHPRAPRPLRDIVRRTTPMESDLIVLGSEVSDDSQASLATSPWASEDLTTDSRLMRDKEEQRSPKPLDRASTGDLRGKSPRAEKTLLQMELQLKSESKSHKALPGIHRKPSREASGELPGSRPQSRAASKQSESLDGTLLAERRTPSKGVLEQSAGNLLPKQTMKGQQAADAERISMSTSEVKES
ncbi:Ranbp2 [Symbiodinium necroappetens]|uniref:Ranbp2 protein n=1 Tax=Symbiodinium necroappetens TaxID=1628268 RepID=A0A812MUH5_9DINO|nr:Ranbp2 [Symbiodinium necroappetens]